MVETDPRSSNIKSNQDVYLDVLHSLRNWHDQVHNNVINTIINLKMLQIATIKN